MKIEIKKVPAEPEGRMLGVGEVVVGALSPDGLKFIFLRKSQSVRFSSALMLYRFDEHGMTTIGPASTIKVYDIQPVKTIRIEI